MMMMMMSALVMSLTCVKFLVTLPNYFTSDNCNLQ